MSKAKLYQVDRDILKRALERNKMTIKDLAELLGRNYNSLTRSLKHNGIQLYELEAIGQRLNLAPEYLMGLTEQHPFTKGVVFNYDFHKSQTLSWKQVTRDFLAVCGIDEMQFNDKQINRIFNAMWETAEKIVNSDKLWDFETIRNETED